MNRLIWCTPGRSDEAELITSVTAAGYVIARRCVDAADLLAAATIETQARVVIDAEVPRIGSEVLASIEATHPGRIVGLVSDAVSKDALAAMGVRVFAQASDSDVAQAVVRALGESRSRDQVSTPQERSGDALVGRLVVVTGPAGAPGRSTVALGLAEQWASAGERVCLVDADTVGPSLACQVGMTEDVSGLLLAARYADQGALDARSLGSACRRLNDNLWFLSGIGSAERWSSVRAAAATRIWATCQAHFDRVVVDAGSLLDTREPDDPLNTRGEARDAVTRSVLGVASEVLIVCNPEPVSVLRLVQQVPAITAAASNAPLRVVVNRVHRRDRSAITRVRDSLQQAGISLPVTSVIEDSTVQVCVRKGALFAEEPKAARLRRSLHKVVREVAA